MTVFSNTVYSSTVYITDGIGGMLGGRRKRRVASYRWTELLRDDAKVLEKLEELQEAQAIPDKVIEIVNKYVVTPGPFPVIDTVKFRKAIKDFAAFKRLIMRAPWPKDDSSAIDSEFDELFQIMQALD